MDGRATADEPAMDLKQEEELSKRSDVWFSDGNVILLAQGTGFKVHRGQLERHSEFFRGLFSIPQSEDDAQKSEGCEVVRIHDTPEDVGCFLRALYDGLYYSGLSADDFFVLSAVMRLSTKYLVDHLSERCINRLSMDWPSTLAAWDAREGEATNELGQYAPRLSFANPVHVIRFARELGHFSVMPAAYYDLCRYSPSKIIAGAPKLQPTNTLVDRSSKNSPNESGEEDAAKLHSSRDAAQLSWSDIHRVLLGREHAQRAFTKFIEDELSCRKISVGCHNKDREGGRDCQESFYFIMLNLLRSVGGLTCGRDCDPLFSLTEAIKMTSRDDFSDGLRLCSLKLCAACKLDFCNSVEATRHKIWAKIPSWFGMVDFTGKRRSA